MKITDKGNVQISTFKDIQVGQVFMSYASGFYYMKTDDIEDVVHGVIRNAVDLHNGESTYFVGCERAVVVNAELIIT